MGYILVDGKHTLEKKIEEVANQPPIKQRKMSEILDDIANHEGMLKLFHLMKQTDDYNRLLFLHPLDLFGKEGIYRPPYLFHGKCPDKKEGESYISRALQALEIDHQAKSSLGLNRLFSQLGIDIEKQEVMGQDIADAIVYVMVSLFRNSDKLLSLIRFEEFNYPILRETMKDYSELIDDDKLKALIDSIFSEKSSDPHVISLIERLILTFIPLVTKSPLRFMESTTRTQSEYAVTYHQTALSILEGLLEKISISFDIYTELMDKLYLFDLIENSHTIFWCETCSRERISYYEIHGKISPSKLVDRNCRECSRRESFSSVYSVEPLLLESIFSRDGLLGVFLSWSLSEASLDFESGVFAGKQEIDVLVRDALIECKTFRLGGREDTLRENLGQALIQIQKQINALEQDGRSVERVMLLCNQPEIKNERSNVSTDLTRLIDQYNIEICSPDEISEIIDSLN